MSCTSEKSGFTLVELLVVITIIGILIALLLPAVQAAREASRRMKCQNNVKQLALGCLSHENATGRFPTNGWGFLWTGDADRGNDWRQPGCWLYNVLPYIEQEPLHDLGLGASPWNSPAKLAANSQRIAVALDVFYCPSRRTATLYPFDTNGAPKRNANVPSAVGHNDYVANGGTIYTNGGGWQGDSTDHWEAGPMSPDQVENPPGTMTAHAQMTFAGCAQTANGIMYCGSMIRMSDVTDGASSTYMIGEKYVNPDWYATAEDKGDSGDPFQGDNADNERWGIPPAMPDTPGVGFANLAPFGSAHPEGFFMAFCDGSVPFMNFSIDSAAHACLSSRNDGTSIDAKKLQ